MKRNFGRFLTLAACVLLLSLFEQARPAAAQSALSNPSFDTPYNNGVANGWAPWHEERNIDVDCNTDSMFRKPQWTPEEVGGNNGQLWFDGNRSQHIGNNFATWHAGVFQTLNVSPGTYSFSTRAFGRASQEQYPAPSDTSVNFTVRVGIDPTGAGLWTSPDIIWSSPITPHDSWQQAVVEATTSGERITVFIAANFAGPGQCRKHLDIWLDGAGLQSTTPPATATSVPPTAQPATATPNWNATLTKRAQEATPTATITPLPSSTPTLTPFPSATAIPTATPNWNATATVRAAQTAAAQPATATPVPAVVFQPTAVPEVPTDEPTEEPTEDAPQNPPTAAPPTATTAPSATPAPQGGTICVNTFADTNANGLRDEQEGYMANVPLFVGKGGAVIHQGTSSGTENALCFDDLEPGEYEVAQRLPGGLEMTTAGNLTIAVSQGQVIGLEFGSRIREATVDTDNDDTDIVADGGDSAEIIPTNTPIPAQTAAPDQSRGLDSLTIAGIALSGIAVVLLGGILVALLRR